MVRVKARKSVHPNQGKYNPRSVGNIIHFVSKRLKGPALTSNGRVRREYRDLSDQIAHALMRDARAGKYEAIRMLIECSEGQVLRQRTVNLYIHRVFTVIEKFVDDPDILFEIGKELNLLKHRIGPGANGKYPNPTYKHPDDLHADAHNDPKFQNLFKYAGLNPDTL